MRPLQLELQAFGPFKQKIIIDFTQFEKDGLFLITGPTGSGKTSIFDALFYALYGQVSNTDRNSITNSIKSQHADDETLCYVDLTFESKNQTYNIYRQPQQLTLGKSGRVISTAAKVKLSHPTLLLEKVEEVKDKIQEVIGLSSEQFKQIVLLPQGDFKRLLFSASNEKEKIFRDIFQTRELETFTLELKDRMSKFQSNLTISNNTLSTLYNSLRNDNEFLQQLFESRQYNELNSSLYKGGIETKEKLDQLTKEITLKEKLVETLNHQVSLINQMNTLLEKQENLNLQKEEILELEKLIEKTHNLMTVHEIKKVIDDLVLKQNSRQQFINDLKHEKETQDLELKKIDSDLQKNALDLKLIDSWNTLIDENKKQLDLIRETKKLLSQKHTLESNLETHKTILNTLLSTLTSLNTDIEKKTLELKPLNDLNQDIAANKEEQYKLDSQIESLNQNQKLLEEIENSLKQKEGLVETLNSRSKEFQEQSLLTTNNEIVFFQQLAGVLAKDLQENTPCPVCGSIDHPHPAHLVDESITQESLNSQKEVVNKLSLALQSTSLQIKHLDETVDNALSKLNLDIDNIESYKRELNESIASSTSSKQQVVQLNQKYQEQLIMKDRLEKELKDLAQKHQMNQLEQAKLQTSIEESNQQLLSITTQINPDVNIEMEESISLLIDETNSKIKKTNQDYQDLTRGRQNLKDILSKTETELASHTEVLKQLQIDQNQQTQKFDSLMNQYQLNLIDLNDMVTMDVHQQNQQRVSDYKTMVEANRLQLETTQKELDQIKDKSDHPQDELFNQQQVLSSLREQSSTTFSQYERITQVQSQFEKELKNYNQLVENLANYSILSEVALGNKENGYLSFERYVLAAYFEEVLHYANERLFEMSQQRYRLVVATEANSRRRSSGLDLEVFDYYTSSTRSVKTLSGGETFNASLALALGLSDVMSQRSGGVSIDALFIDEGFGSLDVNTLDKAVETLFNLKQNGRLVGIISHVSELKQQIESQIIVEKTQSGSTVEIVS